MKIILIIPTYNELENIQKLIPAIQTVLAQADKKHTYGILVVDDNSPDGTANAVKELQKTYSNVSLITGQKAGLGKAYIRGMQYAIESMGAEAVMEMDADFSHKPVDVPRLIAELDNHDFVIGSRYVKGGKIPDNWGILRKLNSKFGNIFARFVAGLYSVKDCTAGFRAIRSSLLRTIEWDSLRAQGYCFQIALLHEAFLRNACIKEVPVEFVDRTSGESKLGLKDIIEFLWFVWIIRLETSKTFFRFLVVGMSGVLVNLGFFSIFLHHGMNKFLASPLSIELSIITNFFLNNFWTFAKRTNETKLAIRGLKFNMVSLVSLVVSFSTFLFLSWLFPSWSPQICQFLGIIPATLLNYFLNSYWTFANKK